MSRRRFLPVLLVVLAPAFVGAQQPDPPLVQTPTVSRETTFLTEPLTDDGRVDYVEAINTRDSTGVTPENNAVTLIWQTLSPYREIADQYREEFFDRLEIPVPPNDGTLLPMSSMMLSQFLKTDAPQVDPKTGRAPTQDQLRARQQTAIENLQQRLMTPWTEKEFPEVAHWFDEHDSLIDQLVTAADRPRYYAPAISPSSQAGVSGVILPTAQISREATRYLIIRAMLSLNRKHPDHALTDLFAVRKLARLLASENPFPIQMLVGYSIDGMAFSAEPHVLASGLLSESQLQQALSDHLDLPEFPSAENAYNSNDRLMTLDLATYSPAFAQQQVPDNKLNPENTPTPAWQQVAASPIYKVPVDIDRALRSVNREYDQITAAFSLPTYSQRHAQLTAIEDRLRGGKAALLHENFLTRAFFAFSWANLDPQSRGDQIGEIILHFNMPYLTPFAQSEAKAHARHRLSQLAFAIALYQSRNKSLPKSLDDLVTSGILKQLPLDPFTDKPFLFHTHSNGWDLSSVGANGIDDSANFDSKNLGKIDDVVFRVVSP